MAWSYRSRIVTMLAAILGALMLAPAGASAHAALAAATPVPDTTIGQSPKLIRVQLNQGADPALSQITLIDTSGRTVAGGPARLAPSDPTIMEVSMGQLVPGLFTVAWQTIAADGHLSKGNYSFTLSSGLGPAPPPDPQPIGALPTTNTPGGTSTISSGGNPSPLTVLVRWWRYLGLGLLFGSLGLAVFVIHPASTKCEDGEMLWRRGAALLRPGILIGSVTFLLAHLATLIVQAAAVADVPVGRVGAGTLRRLLFDTLYGDIWRVIAATCLLILLGALVTLLPFWGTGRRHAALGIIAAPHPPMATAALPPPPLPSLWPWRLGLGIALVLTGTLTLSSHAIESQHQPVLAILADAAHLGAMGLWFGGLVLLVLLRSRLLAPFATEERPALLQRLIDRFSLLGLAAMGTLVVTGLYQMTLHTTRPTILNTSYGQTLLIKHALILPLLIVAAINLRVVKPRLQETERARRLLPRLLVVEATLGALVLLVTALLTQLPPSHLLRGTNAVAADPTLASALAVAPPVTGTPAGPAADLESGPQSVEMLDAPGVMAVLRTTSGKDGGSLHANLVRPEGIPVEGDTPLTSEQLANLKIYPLTDVQRVTAVISFLNADIGQRTVELAKGTDDWYHASGQLFPIKGEWRIQLVIRRENIPNDARLNFSFTSDPARFQATQKPVPPAALPATGLLWPRLLPTASRGFLLAGVGLLLLILSVGGRFRRSQSERMSRVFRLWSVGILLGGIVLIGYYSTDRTPTSTRQNPTANDAATLARGQQLFAQNCAVCHGPLGKGNGELAPQLKPRPADLSGSHAATHTDGDLSWWISRGIPGTGMPAFGATLPDEDIWALIRYLRTLPQIAS